MVAIFFVLSGFGIYQSLERRFGRGWQPPALTRFYIDRAWRVYPLFWLAVLLTPFFILPYSGWHDPTPGLVLKFLGITAFLGDYTRPNDFTWFIHALIPCYLVAPLLFYSIRKLQPARYILLNLALTLPLVAASAWSLRYLSELPDQAFVYRRIILANIFFFSLGMVIYPLLPKLGFLARSRLLGYSAVLASTLLFFGSLRVSRLPDIYFTDSETFLGPLFIFGAFSLCLAVIAVKPWLPLSFVFRFLGRHSYSIYLFHLPFWGLLGLWGITPTGSQGAEAPRANPLYTILLLPFFFAFCVLLDRAVAFLGRRFIQRRSPSSTTSSESMFAQTATAEAVPAKAVSTEVPE